MLKFYPYPHTPYRCVENKPPDLQGWTAIHIHLQRLSEDTVFFPEIHGFLRICPEKNAKCWMCIFHFCRNHLVSPVIYPSVSSIISLRPIPSHFLPKNKLGGVPFFDPQWLHTLHGFNGSEISISVHSFVFQFPGVSLQEFDIAMKHSPFI